MNTPGNRSAAMMAYDPVHNQSVMFGGCITATGACGDGTTWVMADGSAGPGWTQVSPSTAPPGRSAGAMVWDPDLNKLVLFGGVSASGTRLNDTWTWDGTTWAQIFATGTKPPARSNLSMAYDPDRNGVVMFGGQTSATAVADNSTWVLGTSGWTQVLASGASGAPRYRTNAMLAYLGTGKGGQLVLFGGAACDSNGCTNPSASNDTWVLPASGGWVAQTPTQAPPAVQAGVFVYDYGLDAGVLMGGLDASSAASNATWAWTGTSWLKAQDGIGLPSARYSAASVSFGGQVLVYGGVVPAGTSNGELDRWSYSAKQPVLGIAVTSAAGSTAQFLTGQVVTVTVTAQNVGADAIKSSDGTSIGASLSSAGQSVLEAAASTVKWSVNPNDPIPACRSLPAGSDVSSFVAGLVPTVSRAALSAGCTATATFLAVVVGSPQGCALQTISAAATGPFGSSGAATTTIPVCGGGLGKEDWWSYDSTALGGGASADVNVANGNLVVKQSDTTPILSHGDLGYSLNRAYNSQALVSADLNGQKSVFGAGWQLDMGDTGASASGISLGSLIVPSVGQVLDPLAVTYVDRDGTRFVFRPKTPTLGNVTGSLLNATNLLSKVNLTNLLQLPNVFGQDLKSILDSLSGNSPPLVCIDQTFTPPAGADMYLYRYVGFAGGSGPTDCSNATAGRGVTLGYTLVRPDRIRYDFNLLGQLSDTVDGAGNTLLYTYDGSSRPSSVYSGACIPNGQNAPSGVPTGTACPHYTFTYTSQSPGTRIDVTDPAGRLTTYLVASPDLANGAPEELLQVWNPDNPFSTTGTPSERYTYSTTANRCADSDTTASTIAQLCSATDALGNTTTFGYTKAALGPDRVLSVTDRRANSSAADAGPSRGNRVRYTYTAGTTTADSATPNTFGTSGTGCAGNAACERVKYTSINPVGSVGEIDEGNAADVYYRQQGYFWDSDTARTVPACRQPDAIVDYNLCETITRAKVSAAPLTLDKPGTATQDGVTLADHATRYVYGDLGQVLRTQSVVDPAQQWTDANSVTTTYGSHDQYIEAGDTVRAFDDTPKGTGVVESTGGNATTSYGDAIGADNPAAFYRFSELSGTLAADSSSFHQDATYTADTDRGLPGGVPGDLAVGDPGSGATTAALNHLNHFASGTGKDSAFSVEAWEQTTSNDWTSVACSNCGNTTMYVGRYNGAPIIYMSDSSGNSLYVIASSIADGVWHQVDYTYDGSGKAAGAAIYVDGARVATSVVTDTLTGAFRADGDTLGLGYSFTGSAHDGSNLSDVSLYAGKLSAARIAAHYAAAHNVARADATTLYAVTDQTGMLTPRGNQAANASRWGDFLTSYVRDVPTLTQRTATSAPTPNKPLTGPVCTGSARTNTGLLCATVTPASAGVSAGDCPARSVGTVTNPPGSGPSTCVTSTYNTYGEMTAKRSALAHATGASAQTTFTYYSDTGSCTDTGARNCDLSGSVSAGGWLKAVTDTAGHSLIYAYDAAGDITRTWDRNATDGHQLSEDWTNAANPPTRRYAETDMANAVTSASLSAGAKDIEVIHGDGTVWGSGADSQNELGDNTASGSGTATGTPVRAAGLGRVVQVVQNGLAGPGATLTTTARTSTGAVYTWGNNKPVTVVGNLPPIIALAAGAQHYLALDNTGTLWAWGANSSGQLGNGTTTATSTPVKVSISGVSAIAAGANSSYAVRTDGTLWAWGDNGKGQLATGATTGTSTPVKATGLSRVVAVYAATTTGYAIENDGSVWSWGDNTAGALGTGSTDATATTPTRIITLGPGTAAGTIRQIAGSATGAAALTSDGQIYAWGSNSSGQLGSNAGNASSPTIVANVANQAALAGGWATYVSADAGGYLTVWGDTNSGQIGNGTNPATSTPTASSRSHNISPYTSPWRYTRATRDPVGNLMTMVTTPNGNVIQATPARGTAVVTSAYDSTATFSANDQQLSALTPMERNAVDKDGATPAAAPITNTYDTFGNAVSSVDARGYATVTSFDSVNRATAVTTTRGATSQATGSGCSGTASTTAGFTSKQAGDVTCTVSTTYDGTNQAITVSDALGQTTRTTFDGLGRTIAVATPRDSNTTLTSRITYDADGHKLDVCPPRETSCGANGVFSTHMAYDSAGHATTMTRYRDATANPLVTAMTYDADGNTISTTDAAGRLSTTSYDLLDRRTSMSTPRSGTVRNTTRWRYDSSGNVTAVLAPGSAYVGSGADGPLTVDGANYPRSNPFKVPDNAEYTTVTLTNGGWITGQNGGLSFTASGGVTVCSSCGITETGAGLSGGAGGGGGAVSSANGTDGANTASGGKAGLGSLNGSGGGGGGHKTAGANGTASSNASGGAGGAANGTATFTSVGSNYLAAAGGGGGGGGKGTLDSDPAGNGGNGGGFIHITADTITVTGTIEARGTAGQNNPGSSGGGGGGAGGSIWLAASTVSVQSGASVSVAGGAGGTANNGANGGTGAPGFLRIDTDDTLPAGTDASSPLANVTAYSYDADNRPLDTVTGAQTTDATDTSSTGAPGSDGLTNTRTRTLYDADGHVIATVPAQAFSAANGALKVDVDYVTRTEYDFDGRPTASYVPRYNSAVTDAGAGNDAGTGVNQQTAQCPTGKAQPDLAPGLTGYATSVGVCVTRSVFDADGNIIRQWLPTSNGSDNRYVLRTYSDDDLALTETQPDPSSNGARVTAHTYRYDGDRRPLQDTDANGNVTVASYTADGLTASTEQQCYRISGDKALTDCGTSGGPHVYHRTSYGYDADGHQITVTQPRAQDPTQSSAANLTAADFTTTTDWTSDGLKSRIKAPGLGHSDFNITTYTYDNVGNPLTTTMPSANAPTADDDNPNRLATTYAFTDDNLIAVSSTPVASGKFRNTVYSYNPAGQKTATSVCTVSGRTSCPKPDATATDTTGVTRYSYGPNGLVINQIAKANTATTTITTSYDTAGRVRAVKDSGSGTTITAGYYLDGLLRTADDGTNTNTYAYDGAGHLSSRSDKTAAGGITDGALKRTSYAYNDASLLATMTSDVHAGDTSTLGYDAGGRMTSWTDTGGGTGQTRAYSYLPDDRLWKVTTKAAGDSSDRQDYAYAYDDDGNIASQTVTGSAATNATNTYAYNPAGNITSYGHAASDTDASASATTTYTWDHNANRLAATVTSGATTTNSTWTYRADNSIATLTSTTNGAASQTSTYSYNQAGLRTNVTPGGATGSCAKNTYDGFDRIATSVTGTGSTCATPKTVTYTYDGLDRQRTAVTSGTTTGDGTTVTIYDGLTSNTSGQSGAVTNDNKRPTNLYELTPDGQHTSVWQASSASSAASLIDDDGNGNTGLVLNTSKTGSDATGCAAAYDPFGNPLTAKTATTTVTSSGVCSSGSDMSTTGIATWYNDQRRDGSTGAYQLGTRTYNPGDAAFSTPDSYRVATASTDLAVGTDPLTANTYTYVNGNPLNYTDPTGHMFVVSNDHGSNQGVSVADHAQYGPDSTQAPNATDRDAAPGYQAAIHSFRFGSVADLAGGLSDALSGIAKGAVAWSPTNLLCGGCETQAIDTVNRKIQHKLGANPHTFLYGVGEVAPYLIPADAEVAASRAASRAAARADQAVDDAVTAVGRVEPKAATREAKTTDRTDQAASDTVAPNQRADVANSERTPVYRVESPGNARIDIGQAGEVGVKGDNMLFLNFGDEGRAIAFQQRRLAQGFEDTVIKTFDVENSYLDALRATAVPESMAWAVPGSPLVVDVNQAADQFGLRACHFRDLLASVVPGSGRVC